MKSYSQTAAPTAILQIFLNVFTTGEVKGDNWKMSSFPNKKALLHGGSIKEICGMFGIETIILWNALVLKKRVAVICDKLPRLLSILRTLPQFVWHRQDWSFLRPYCTLSGIDLQELDKAGVFCAGFLEPESSGIRSKEELYDILVDVPNRSISISQHAKADFAMSNPHKEIASFIVEASENANATDQQIIKQLAIYAQNFQGELSGLATDGKLTREAIQVKVKSSVMERFLYNLAAAEGLMSH